MAKQNGGGAFKIERGIKMPEQKSGRRRKYPFPEMKVGDSFAASGSDAASVSNLTSSASYFGRRNKMQFSVRRDPQTNGYRCWRIA